MEKGINLKELGRDDILRRLAKVDGGQYLASMVHYRQEIEAVSDKTR